MTHFSAIDRQYSTAQPLGAIYSADSTRFAVWSPAACAVSVNLYNSGDDSAPLCSYPMTKDEKGVWHLDACGDLDGKYYTYSFCIDGTTREAPDIYSRSAGINGRKSMIFSERSVSVEGWEDDLPVRLKSPCDAIICEAHIRDLSMDENADFALRGKFLSLCETGVKNSHGDSAGLDYLTQLGITHLHLLPVMQNASVDERSPQFNWGYDPLLYNVPEGSYTTDPHDGRQRVRELRRLVQALHSHGIGVVLDVVYNHTFSVEDSPFTAAFPHYYYRHDGEEYSNGSGCGNELATERKMVSRFICDSLCALARDYHVDGFRFDLMGLMDIPTLNRCAKALRKINPDILLYGEGWTGGASPLPENRRALKHRASETAGAAMFSDDFRDGVKGSVFNDRDRGYINGIFTRQRQELIKSVMCGGVFHPQIDRPEWQCWAKAPTSCVNYVEAHDNLTLHDKLKLSMPKASAAERERTARLGIALVLLSQGIPFFQAGMELHRSKPDGNGGFVHDSYNSPDSINCIKWDDVTRCRATVEYMRGLIAIRKEFPQLRLTSAEEVRKIRIERLSGAAFALHNSGLILAVNPHRRPARIKLPAGEYHLLANDMSAGLTPLNTTRGSTSVPPQSILLLCKV